MNENKIAFIICSNDELAMKECVRYINRLNVPDGIETDIMGVQGADSMCAGYNAAMHESDAKYKVYMHQDVFILNMDFIADVISIFKNNPSCGLLGLLGTSEFVEDADYWRVWDTGDVRWGGILREVGDDETKRYSGDDLATPDGMKPMTAIDGMMMITQYDVEWREDIFDGFDFYDVSQSLEFHKAGYEVGIARQRKAWALHDCGDSNMRNYDRYRRILCENYSGFGYIYKENPINRTVQIQDEALDNSSESIVKRIESGDTQTAFEIMCERSKVCHTNNRTARYSIICNVANNEAQYGARYFLEDGGLSIHELEMKLARYRYFLRRVELGFPLEDDEVLLELKRRGDTNLIDMRIIAQTVSLTPQETINRLADALES